jgi:hypothetical protein
MKFPDMVFPLLARHRLARYEAPEDQHDLRRYQSASSGEE